MRLFSKASPSHSVRGTRPSSTRSPNVLPKNPKVQSHRSASRNYADADPYSLTSVHTAHDYESDDSDAELERIPSRYELKDHAPDDIEFDDCSNDRYSEVGRRLALMSNDSDSAQWRSFDEFDERDPKSAVFDPLLIDRDSNDWDDIDSSRQQVNSAKDYRDGARLMRSLTDDAGFDQDDDESPSASTSSVLESEVAEVSTRGSQEVSNEKMPAPVPLFRSDSVSEAASQSGVRNREGGAKYVSSGKRERSNEQALASSPANIPRSMCSVSEKEETPSQVQNDIVERVAHELKASKKKGQFKDNPINSQKPKVFGLFRRKAPKDSDNNTESRPTNQQQLGRSVVENQSDPLLTNHDSENLENPVEIAPRSILKASSFAARPDDDANENNDEQITSEPPCAQGFFSRLFAGNNGESEAAEETAGAIANDSHAQENMAPESSGFLFALCGLHQAVIKESSDEQVSSDPVMDIRSPSSNDAVPDEGAVLMLSETVKQKQGVHHEKSIVDDVDEKQRTHALCIPDNSFCLRGPVSNTATDAKDSATPVDSHDKESKIRSTAVENEIQGTNEEYADAGNELVLVQCLRDSHCNGGADCVVRNITRLDNLGCQQTFEFMDDFVTAKDPKVGSAVDAPVIEAPAIEARALSLEANEGKGSGQRRWRKKTKDRQPDELREDVHDLPIKMIEFPRLTFDQESASGASLGSFGGRRKNGLVVDTKLEHEMRQLQEELAGTKKKSLFGRIKRGSKA